MNFEDKLREVTADEAAAWDRALARTFPTRRRWWIGSVAAAAIIGVVTLLLLIPGEPDLATAMIRTHEKNMPAIVTADHGEYFRRYFDFNTEVEGMELTGARKCSLGSAPVAYLMAKEGEHRISIYIMKRSPGLEGKRIRESRGGYNLLVHDDGERIICAVGTCPPETLQRLAR